MFLDIAGTPLGLHLFDTSVGYLDANDLLPLFDQCRDRLSEVCTVPIEHDALVLGTTTMMTGI